MFIRVRGENKPAVIIYRRKMLQLTQLMTTFHLLSKSPENDACTVTRVDCVCVLRLNANKGPRRNTWDTILQFKRIEFIRILTEDIIILCCLRLCVLRSYVMHVYNVHIKWLSWRYWWHHCNTCILQYCRVLSEIHVNKLAVYIQCLIIARITQSKTTNIIRVLTQLN